MYYIAILAILKGGDMRVIFIKGHSPGKRDRLRIAKNKKLDNVWVRIRGFLFLPIPGRRRSWGGLAIMEPTQEPEPTPERYVKITKRGVFEIAYNPFTNEYICERR